MKLTKKSTSEEVIKWIALNCKKLHGRKQFTEEYLTAQYNKILNEEGEETAKEVLNKTITRTKQLIKEQQKMYLQCLGQ